MTPLTKDGDDLGTSANTSSPVGASENSSRSGWLTTGWTNRQPSVIEPTGAKKQDAQ